MTDREWAADLLSQQLWFWGQDVVRLEGNWLTEIGFQRTPPPENRQKCSSVYTLELSAQRRIILRGFGVFIGDDAIGGLFIKRFGFEPRCSRESTLKCPPWSSDDLPKFQSPSDEDHPAFVQLLLDLIEWTRSYEANVETQLGLEYRLEVFDRWDDGERTVIPVEQIDTAWKRLAGLIASDSLPWMRSANSSEHVGIAGLEGRAE